MGISRDHWHKRRATGGKRAPIRQKRKFELGRPAAMTKLGPQRIHTVRVRGGNKKYRALRLDQGNFSWGSEAITRKTRIIEVVYNAANNELVRTKTLVKNAIIVIDTSPFRQCYDAHYARLNWVPDASILFSFVVETKPVMWRFGLSKGSGP